VGIMVEVPAAALMADAFAAEVDFFSIGTNDLTQYTLAMDRMHPTLATKSDGLHPAVLRLVERTVRAAHDAGKWVGVCGELGADPQAVPILIGLGVDELSVNVPAVPTVKAQIRSLNWGETKQLAAQALACTTAQEVREKVTFDE
jgi:phosphocarrier protein FPr